MTKQTWSLIVGFIICIGGMMFVKTSPAVTLVLVVIGGGMMIPAYGAAMRHELEEWEKLPEEEKRKRSMDIFPPF